MGAFGSFPFFPLREVLVDIPRSAPDLSTSRVGASVSFQVDDIVPRDARDTLPVGGIWYFEFSSALYDT